MTIGRSRTWPLRAWPLKHIVDSLCELSHPAHFEFPPCSCAIERKTPQQCLFASIFAATTIAFDHVKCLALFHDVWRVRGAPRIIVLRCSFTAVYTYICQPWTILSLMEGRDLVFIGRVFYYNVVVAVLSLEWCTSQLSVADPDLTFGALAHSETLGSPRILDFQTRRIRGE
jgi:hypothetical protein